MILLAAGYFIWQFNPVFNLPKKKQEGVPEEADSEGIEEDIPVIAGQTVNELYGGNTGQKTNTIKSDPGIVINFPDETPHRSTDLFRKWKSR